MKFPFFLSALTSESAMPSLPERYKTLIAEKGYSFDAEQERAVIVLQKLLQKLVVKKSFWPFARQETPKGVYMYGGVGRGKSMLMDLFFDEAPATLAKRRIHFHEFMIKTHDWLHANRGQGLDDLLVRYADHVRKNVQLLCFDEFHVTDVADAMILGRLFTALIEKGIVVVATSNKAPDELYEGGLQRDLFLPFIAFLKLHNHVVHLGGKKDYRAIALPDQDMYYFSPLNRETAKQVERLFSELSGDREIETRAIAVKGRKIMARATGDIARFTFAELCEKPLAAEDYIKIARTFDTVFIENITRLDETMRNEAKRFILLIDCLYEEKCRIILSAEADVHSLYSGGDHEFEFQRTVSRLMEMQSSAYHDSRI
jgi:cell division protein ZapE